MPRSLGTWLIVAGLLLVLIGVLANTGVLSWFGRLPGDIRIERDNARFYFPVTSMVIVSIVLSAIIYLVSRFGK